MAATSTLNTVPTLRARPNVFIDEPELKELWDAPNRYYLVTDHEQMDHLKSLLGFQSNGVVAASGGKFLLSNHPLSYSMVPRAAPPAYTR